MIINKDYLSIMRRGKLQLSSSINKQKQAGMILALCMFIACIVIVIGIFSLK